MYRIAVALITLTLAGMLAVHRAEAQTQRRPGGPGGVDTSHLPPSKAAPDARVTDVPTSLGGQVQTSLEKLADDLRITAGQQKAWNTFATRVIRLADDVARARFALRDLEGTVVTAPQLFDRIVESQQNRMTAVEDIVEAGRELYQKLSVEQQKLADRRLALVAIALVSGVPPPGTTPDAATAGRPAAKP